MGMPPVRAQPNDEVVILSGASRCQWHHGRVRAGQNGGTGGVQRSVDGNRRAVAPQVEASMSRRYVMRLRRPSFTGRRTPVVTAGESAARLVVLGLGSVAVTVLLWVGTTQTFEGQRIADLILYGRLAADAAVVGAAVETLATVSLAFVALATFGLCLTALARGGIGFAVAVVVAIGGANLTTQALKQLLERPNLLGDLAYATGNSFPSGHVTLASSLGLAAVMVVPRRFRTPVALGVVILISAVGVSTIVAGWHRLADVDGAIFISLAWASLSTGALVRAQGWIPRRTWGRGLGGRVTRLAGFAGGAAVLVGVVGIAVAVVDPTPLADAIKAGIVTRGVFVAAMAIAAGTSMVACAAFVWAMLGVALERPG
jgi:membrane-associated phospholipid phosphatase